MRRTRVDGPRAKRRKYLGAKRAARRKYMAELAEVARLARHDRRFSPTALRERATLRLTRALIRNTITHYAARGLRITEDGYKALTAKAAAQAVADRGSGRLRIL